MFDIGFWELALIGVIALLVVGPERLPELARTVGLWVGRARRYVTHVKRDIERELHADEMRELLQKRDGLGDLREVAEQTASVLKDARSELDEAARDSDGSGGEAGGTGEEPAKPPRRVPHHAVHEDPFATRSLASVSPGPAAEPESPQGTEHDDEPRTDRPPSS